jgi:HPt (histidine-containing phosphotransfer) domain-containing protein
MPIDKLRADLARLRDEIARTQSGDSESLARLEQLARDIENELEQEKSLADPAGLISELQESVSGFEASHPNLTAIVNNILVILGGIGV